MPGALRESSRMPGASLEEPYKNGNIKVEKKERVRKKRVRMREIDWRERSIARTIDLKHIVKRERC